MAVCAGCTAENCNCSLTVMDTASLDLTLTGTGAAGDPWVLSGEAAGGGGSGQILFFTVATPGIVAFGGLGATPPGPLSTADFVGDGVNDNVAIQAGIDAVVALTALGGADIILHILPGFYLVNATLIPRGVKIRGQHKDMVNWFMNSGFGAPANARLFDGTAGTLNVLNIESINISHDTGGAAVVFVNHIYAQRCNFNGTAIGADLGYIVCQNITDDGLVLGKFNDNAVIGALGDPHLVMQGTLSFGNFMIRDNNINGDVILTAPSSLQGLYIQSNNIAGDLDISGGASSRDWFVQNNRLSNGSLILNTAQMFYCSIKGNVIVNGNLRITGMIVSTITENIITATIFGVGIVLTTTGENIIQGNWVDGASGHGMTLVTCNNNLITGNRLRGYTANGINVVTSDDNTFQINDLASGGGTAGINIVSGLANFVTNNDLRGSGTTPFIDTGTATATGAGNRLG